MAVGKRHTYENGARLDPVAEAKYQAARRAALVETLAAKGHDLNGVNQNTIESVAIEEERIEIRHSTDLQ